MKSVRPWVIQYLPNFSLEFLTQPLEALLVGEEVVVQEEDEVLLAGFHLVGDVLGREEPRLAIVELPDRAEVAVEAAAAGGEDARQWLGGEEEVLPLVLLDKLAVGGREVIDLGPLGLAALGPRSVGQVDPSALRVASTWVLGSASTASAPDHVSTRSWKVSSPSPWTTTST